jgi:hypothetical protein
MKILDNLFTVEEIKKIYNHYRAYPYKRIEVDGPGLPYTGLSCNLDLNDEIVKLIIEKTNTEKDNLLRAYINLFLKDEKPYFHQDDTREGHRTLLYYMNPEPKDFNDLGETFFYIDKEVKSVQPIPGRVVIFDARIWHRASALRNHDRYTVALKW